MAQRSRKFTRITGVRSPDLLVIASEGAVTEVNYFQGVKSKIEESRINIEVLSRVESAHSGAERVIRQLDKYKRESGIGKSDQLCLVLDRDSQSLTEKNLARVAKECDSKGYILALSNPCFEIWLLMHFKCLSEFNNSERAEMLNSKSRDMQALVRNCMPSGFQPTKLKIDDFWDSTEIAAERAEKADEDKNLRWPNVATSRIYLIMQKILPAH